MLPTFNVDVSEMSVPKLMDAVGNSGGESSLGVTGRGFSLRRENSVMYNSVSCVGLTAEARESCTSRADGGPGSPSVPPAVGPDGRNSFPHRTHVDDRVERGDTLRRDRFQG